jgi:hypothetical protein
MEAYKVKALREYGTTKGYLNWLDNSLQRFHQRKQENCYVSCKRI